MYIDLHVKLSDYDGINA